MSSFRFSRSTGAAQAQNYYSQTQQPASPPVTGPQQVFQQGGLTQQAAPSTSVGVVGVTPPPNTTLAGQGALQQNVAATPSPTAGTAMAKPPADGAQGQPDELEGLWQGLVEKKKSEWADTNALVQAQNAAFSRRAMAMQGAMGTAVAGGFVGAIGGAFAAGQNNLLQAQGQYRQSLDALYERIAAEKTRRSERTEDISRQEASEGRDYLSQMGPKDLYAEFKAGQISQEEFARYAKLSVGEAGAMLDYNLPASLSSKERADYNKWVRDWTKKYGRVPTQEEADNYFESTGGNIEDVDAWYQAERKRIANATRGNRKEYERQITALNVQYKKRK